ncbi:helix-turn-helix transcriptional regulator [Demetria terragena]|uniref:helix-turn-helix transcriptional regulator n=1 Tax=Demetria terragena TaxID=63959 RepID=UPI000371537F|nr:YafY family protein [Demetria terragena]
MSDTTARVLQLLGLLQSRPVWTGPELADRLGVTTRSIRRDVDRLRELGYPVLATHGTHGGYQLGAGKALPPLLLDSEEAVAVAVCLRLAAGGTVAGVGEAALRTMTKLDQVLPATLRAQVAAVQEATVTLDFRPIEVDPDILLVLARAVRDSVQARFAYTARDGVSTDRRIEPYRLVATGRRWYLMAYDLDRDDWRTFRLDRMSDARASTFTFRPRESPDPEEYIRQSMGASWPISASVLIHAPLEEVRTQVGSYVEAEEVEASVTRVLARSHHLQDIAWWLLRLPFDLEVERPTELRAAFATLGERAAHAARGGTVGA